MAKTEKSAHLHGCFNRKLLDRKKSWRWVECKTSYIHKVFPPLIQNVPLFLCRKLSISLCSPASICECCSWRNRTFCSNGVTLPTSLSLFDSDALLLDTSEDRLAFVAAARISPGFDLFTWKQKNYIKLWNIFLARKDYQIWYPQIAGFSLLMKLLILNLSPSLYVHVVSDSILDFPSTIFNCSNQLRWKLVFQSDWKPFPTVLYFVTRNCRWSC